MAPLVIRKIRDTAENYYQGLVYRIPDYTRRLRVAALVGITL